MMIWVSWKRTLVATHSRIDYLCKSALVSFGTWTVSMFDSSEQLAILYLCFDDATKRENNEHIFQSHVFYTQSQIHKPRLQALNRIRGEIVCTLQLKLFKMIDMQIKDQKHPQVAFRTFPVALYLAVVSLVWFSLYFTLLFIGHYTRDEFRIWFTVAKEQDRCICDCNFILTSVRYIKSIIGYKKNGIICIYGGKS